MSHVVLQGDPAEPGGGGGDKVGVAGARLLVRCGHQPPGAAHGRHSRGPSLRAGVCSELLIRGTHTVSNKLIFISAC